jgi:hypothetical protein
VNHLLELGTIERTIKNERKRKRKNNTLEFLKLLSQKTIDVYTPNDGNIMNFE